MPNNLISIQALDEVMTDIGSARGMPNAAYHSEELFRFERDEVLSKTWAGLVFESELPEPNFAHPIDFMGLPLVAVRGADDQIRIFHNVCSHRGMPLVSEPGTFAGTIRCAYHRWGYTAAGALRATPNIGGAGVHTVEGFDCTNHGLKRVRSASFMGIIFVNLDGNAPELDAHTAPIKNRWEKFTNHMDQLTPAKSASSLRLEVASNWKLPVENYCEAHHLPWVHPGLNRYSPLEQHFNLIVNEYASGQGSMSYTHSEVAGTTLPKFSDWPEEKKSHAEYISLYPNVLLGLQVDHAFAIILDPVSPGKTIERLELQFVGKSAIEQAFVECRDAVLSAWQEVFAEDIFAVEGMQRGRLSPAFKGGLFSPVLDESTHHFHLWLAHQYRADYVRA